MSSGSYLESGAAMPHQHLRRQDPNERRSCDRFPIERDVKYRILGTHKNVIQIGLGKGIHRWNRGLLERIIR